MKKLTNLAIPALFALAACGGGATSDEAAPAEAEVADDDNDAPEPVEEETHDESEPHDESVPHDH